MGQKLHNSERKQSSSQLAEPEGQTGNTNCQSKTTATLPTIILIIARLFKSIRSHVYSRSHPQFTAMCFFTVQCLWKLLAWLDGGALNKTGIFRASYNPFAKNTQKQWSKMHGKIMYHDIL